MQLSFVGVVGGWEWILEENGEKICFNDSRDEKFWCCGLPKIRRIPKQNNKLM